MSKNNSKLVLPDAPSGNEGGDNNNTRNFQQGQGNNQSQHRQHQYPIQGSYSDSDSDSDLDDISYDAYKTSNMRQRVYQQPQGNSTSLVPFDEGNLSSYYDSSSKQLAEDLNSYGLEKFYAGDEYYYKHSTNNTTTGSDYPYAYNSATTATANTTNYTSNYTNNYTNNYTTGNYSQGNTYQSVPSYYSSYNISYDTKVEKKEKPKNPFSVSVTFHVFVEDLLMRENSVVAIVGDIEELGYWEYPVFLSQHPTNSRHWLGTIHLLVDQARVARDAERRQQQNQNQNQNQQNNQKIHYLDDYFEYKFVIVHNPGTNNQEVVWEDDPNRRFISYSNSNNYYSNYYYSTNYQHGNYRPNQPKRIVISNEDQAHHTKQLDSSKLSELTKNLFSRENAAASVGLIGTNRDKDKDKDANKDNNKDKSQGPALPELLPTAPSTSSSTNNNTNNITTTAAENKEPKAIPHILISTMASFRPQYTTFQKIPGWWNRPRINTLYLFVADMIEDYLNARAYEDKKEKERKDKKKGAVVIEDNNNEETEENEAFTMRDFILRYTNSDFLNSKRIVNIPSKDKKDKDGKPLMISKELETKHPLVFALDNVVTQVDRINRVQVYLNDRDSPYSSYSFLSVDERTTLKKIAINFLGSLTSEDEEDEIDIPLDLGCALLTLWGKSITQASTT